MLVAPYHVFHYMDALLLLPAERECHCETRAHANENANMSCRCVVVGVAIAAFALASAVLFGQHTGAVVAACASVCTPKIGLLMVRARGSCYLSNYINNEHERRAVRTDMPEGRTVKAQSAL